MLYSTMQYHAVASVGASEVFQASWYPLSWETVPSTDGATPGSSMALSTFRRLVPLRSPLSSRFLGWQATGSFKKNWGGGPPFEGSNCYWVPQFLEAPKSTCQLLEGPV